MKVLAFILLGFCFIDVTIILAWLGLLAIEQFIDDFNRIFKTEIKKPREKREEPISIIEQLDEVYGGQSSNK